LQTLPFGSVQQLGHFLHFSTDITSLASSASQSLIFFYKAAISALSALFLISVSVLALLYLSSFFAMLALASTMAALIYPK